MRIELEVRVHPVYKGAPGVRVHRRSLLEVCSDAAESQKTRQGIPPDLTSTASRQQAWPGMQCLKLVAYHAGEERQERQEGCACLCCGGRGLGG